MADMADNLRDGNAEDDEVKSSEEAVQNGSAGIELEMSDQHHQEKEIDLGADMDEVALEKNGDEEERLDSTSDLVSPTYRMYKMRWYIVGTLAVLNISNAMGWICFAAITPFTAEYFDVSVNAVNWFSIIYMVVSIPMGFVVAWQLDTLGFRTGILTGAWLNLLGLLVRYLATVFPLAPSDQYIVCMLGQTIAAFAQPYLLFSPTKMAALWFSENQRATANMLATMANPVGILLSFALSATLVSEPDDLPLMLWVFVIPAGIGVLMATLGVCSSAPPTPPSKSADDAHETFGDGCRMLLRNRQFWVLWFTFGAGYGIFNAISTFLAQITCPMGYDDNFAGLIGALMIFAGLAGAAVAGIIVDKTKKFTPVVKFCYCFAIIFGFILSISSQFDNAGIGLLVGGTGFGLFGLAQFAVALELGVECSYPVAEGTSACILQVSGQLQGVILIVLGQVLAQEVSVDDRPDQVCIDTSEPNATMATTTGSDYLATFGTTPYTDVSYMPTTTPKPETILDMTIPLFSFASYGLLIVLILLFCFHTKYRRLEAELESQKPEDLAEKSV